MISHINQLNLCHLSLDDHIAKQTISLDASETLTEKSIPLNIQETGVSQVVITAKSLAKSDGDLAIDNAKIKLQEVSNGKIESIAIEQMPSKTVMHLEIRLI